MTYFFLGGIRRRHGFRIIRLGVGRYVNCPEFYVTTLDFFDSITALSNCRRTESGKGENKN